MSTVWREYGVIGILLVVAIGGYLFVSRHQEDLLAISLDAIGTQLLALVPEQEGRDRVAEALDRFKERVASKEVDADKVEQFAASVLNLGSTGESLDSDEAEMVIQLALDSAPALPVPDSSGTGTVVMRVPRPPAPPATEEELIALGERLEPMIAFYHTMRAGLPTDTTKGVPVRFYAQNGLHVVVDDRYREQIEADAAAKKLMIHKAVSWRARLADATEAERDRADSYRKQIETWRIALDDSLVVSKSLEQLAKMRRLESLGVLSEPEMDSVLVRVEHEIRRAIARIPAPPPPASAAVDVVSSKSDPNG